jgi:ABC-type nitrate/sulfonate/bicarbonate transport system substrate-binding protein
MGWLMAVLWLVAWPAHALDVVRLQLKWQHQFQFAGYYAAKAQGYYRDAGLDVQILPSQPNQDSEQVVLAGGAEYGVGTTEVLLRRSQGDPLVVLAVIFQHSPLVLAVPRRTDTGSLHDLAGKRLMIEPGSAELLAYLKREGLDSSRFQRITNDFSVQDLVTGRADGMSVYTTDEPFELIQAGVPHTLYSPRMGGIDFYGDNLFTTQAQVLQQPEQVATFRAASVKGWAYAMAHPDEIAQLIFEQYSQRHSLAHLRFEAQQMAPLLRADLVEPGHMYRGRWEHIAQVYAELGMLPPDYNLDGFLYDPSGQQQHDLAWATRTNVVLLLVLLVGGGGGACAARQPALVGEREALAPTGQHHAAGGDRGGCTTACATLEQGRAQAVWLDLQASHRPAHDRPHCAQGRAAAG